MAEGHRRALVLLPPSSFGRWVVVGVAGAHPEIRPVILSRVNAATRPGSHRVVDRRYSDEFWGVSFQLIGRYRQTLDGSRDPAAFG